MSLLLLNSFHVTDFEHFADVYSHAQEEEYSFTEYHRRAKLHEQELTTVLTPASQSKLKFLIIQTMEDKGYTSSDQLSHAESRNILGDWHSDLPLENQQLLNRIGFKTVSAISIHADKALGKIKALMPVLFNKPTIHIEDGFYEYEKLLTFQEPPMKESVRTFLIKSEPKAYELLKQAKDRELNAEDRAKVINLCFRNKLSAALLWFVSHQNETRLDLSDWGIYTDEKKLEFVISLLKNPNPKLRTLNLSNNFINSDGVESLCGVLETNTTLLNLDLENNQFGQYGVERLNDMLKRNKTLNSLEFNIEGSEKLTKDINKKLQSRCLHYNV